MTDEARLAAGLAACLSAWAAAPAAADPVALATAGSAAFCAERGQTLALGPEPTTAVDLTGDGVMDLIVSEQGARCEPGGGPLEGTGGWMHHLVVDGKITSRMALGWLVADLTFPGALEPLRVLHLARHGSTCDGYGAQPCVETLVWSEGAFLSVAPPEPAE